MSTNTSCELDPNARKRAAREGTGWREKSQKSGDHLKQSKDARRLDDRSFQECEEHSACHITSQCKHCSVAVIKDNEKRGHDHRITGLKSAESFRTSITKELPEESAENRKRVAGKPTFHETIQSQTCKLLQKDLKTTVDGDVRYTAEEMRLLKEYRKAKERILHQDTQEERKRSRREEGASVEGFGPPRLWHTSSERELENQGQRRG